MPTTHTSLQYHLVFSTKNRHPFIGDDVRARLHAFLGGTVKKLDGVPEAIGGTADHVHLLVSLNPTHRLADVLRDVKHGSSQWVHTNFRLPAFSWQDGYGAFSVSASNVEAVRHYIDHQAEHHRRKTFEEEYVEFLTRSGIAYDERFLW